MRRHLLCPVCEGPVVRVEKHDAHACMTCDVWVEDRCSDPGCSYCVSRPARPSEVDDTPVPVFDRINGHAFSGKTCVRCGAGRSWAKRKKCPKGPKTIEEWRAEEES